jgi:uncharacterized membrane protein YkoI
MLLAAMLLSAGASALPAQQPRYATAEHTTTHHATTRHGRHQTTTTTYAMPARLGRPVAYHRASAIARARLPRLSNGLITPEAARAIALRTNPGGTSVDRIRLGTENRRQVYDVKVVKPRGAGKQIVRVDARTGAVLETRPVRGPVGAVTGAVKRPVGAVTGGVKRLFGKIRHH